AWGRCPRPPGPAPWVTPARPRGASRRPVAPWRPSGPDRTITSPARASAGARKTGGRASPPGAAARSAAVERVPQPGEEPLLAGREPARRGLLAPELGQLLEQRFLLFVELGRSLHRHVDDQVTAPGV